MSEWNKKCDFCNLEKRFGSEIIINYCGESIGKIKVCPECRSKHTIEDLYEKRLRQLQGQTKRDKKHDHTLVKMQGEARGEQQMRFCPIHKNRQLSENDYCQDCGEFYKQEKR